MNGVLHFLLIIFKEDVQFFLNIILDGIYNVPFKLLLEIKHEQRTMKKKINKHTLQTHTLKTYKINSKKDWGGWEGEGEVKQFCQ